MSRLRAMVVASATTGALVFLGLVVTVKYLPYEAHARIDQTVTTQHDAAIGIPVANERRRIGTVAIPRTGLGRIDLGFAIDPATGSGEVQLELAREVDGDEPDLRRVAVPVSVIGASQSAAFVFDPVERREAATVELFVRGRGIRSGQTVVIRRRTCECVRMLATGEDAQPEVSFWTPTKDRKARFTLFLDRLDATRPAGFGATMWIVAGIISAVTGTAAFWLLVFLFLQERPHVRVHVGDRDADDVRVTPVTTPRP